MTLDRDDRFYIWLIFSVLWVVFALYNIVAVTGDLWAALSDHPTEDEKTVAWQRFRDTLFRLFLAGLFTFVAWASRRTSPAEGPIREVDTLREVMILVIVFTPVVGSFFEGWRIRDRWHMGAAYAALYRRKKDG